MVKNNSLRQGVFAGLRYNSAAKILEVLFAVSYGVFMARLLDPSVFGVLAMASIFTGISAIFIDFGTGDAIICHDEDKVTNEFLSSIFWLNTFIGLFIAVIFVLLSKPISTFFGHEIIKTIIIIYSINIVFSAMSNVPRSLIRKKMDFKSIFYQRVFVLPISSVIGIILALKGYGIWSIIVQQIILTTGGTFLFIYLSKWFPSFTFKRQHIGEIFNFSSYLSAMKFLNYFTKKGDLFLIGKFLGDYQLGIYSKGYQLTVTMLKTINGIILGVLYPSISKIKDNKQILRKSFLEVSQVVFTIYSFVVLLGFLFSEKAVNVILGEKWSDLAPMIPIFLLLSLFFALGSTGGHYLQALGHTKLLFKIVIFTSALTIISFIVGLNWGILGVALGYLFSTTILFFIASYNSLKILRINIRDYIPIFVKETGVLILSAMFIKLMFSIIIIESDFYYLLIGILFALTIQFLYHYLNMTLFYKVSRTLIKYR
jgi:O-antigen/teichoic acid export membrane protein